MLQFVHSKLTRTSQLACNLYNIIVKEGFRIKRIVAFVLIGLCFMFIYPVPSNAIEQSIQEQINASKPGDVIRLKEGVYEENITITKPIHLVGTENVTVSPNNSIPVITIAADNVVLENLHIEHSDLRNESPAIFIHSHANSLLEINIDTSSYGIQLEEANDNLLSDLTIRGNKNTPMKDRRHGINILKSHNNEIRHSTISDVLDGIYIEKSSENKVYNNKAFQSRYGYHLMFTKNTVLEHNKSYENISGMMIMGADGSIVRDNLLTNNQSNIQSLGLFVFDTLGATIIENEITNNRIGIFMEDARNNAFSFNKVHENYIGLQFKASENNDVIQNSFIANVVQGQAKDSTDNHINNNYWGDHFGLDLNGDRFSNLPYKVNPFFLTITNEYPPFQLLFQSPGMVFLEQLIYLPIEEQLVDLSPLMNNPSTLSSDLYQNQFSIFLICLSIFILSLIIIYLGVRINEKG